MQQQSTPKYLIAVLGLLLTLEMATSSPPAVQVPLGLTPTEFDTIKFSSCTTELASHPHNGLDVWNELTQFAFAKISSTSTPHPFILCDRTPGLSGNKRTKAMKRAFEGAVFSEFPMYNGGDMTCVLIRASGDTIRGVTVASADVKIQPLLPMMKTGKGVIDACKKRFGDGSGGGGVSARINAMLGPGVANEVGSADALGRKVLDKMKGSTMGVALRETFPSSEREILEGLGEEKLGESFFQRVSVSSGYKGESISFDIQTSTPGVSWSKVLAFLAGLASQPEITSVEVQGEMNFQG